MLKNRLIFLFLTIGFLLPASLTVADDASGLTVSSLADEAFIVSAHRAGPASGFPENAIETMQHRLARDGFMVFELDVRALGDGTLVLMHDNTLDRTSNGNGTLKALVKADLDGIRLKDNRGRPTPYKIPTLREALRWANERSILILDIKPGVEAAKLARVIKEEGAEARVLIICYRFMDARTYARLLPASGLTVTVQNEQRFQALKALNLPRKQTWIWTGRHKLPSDFYARMKKVAAHIQRATFGAIDNQAAAARSALIYSEILADGVTVLATNKPGRAVKARPPKTQTVAGN